ncbi:TetR/AcrR family transcriptional regulator [Plantactinospora sp. BB1]|uniref:TetR/AcrR family transcriptional regulator n=1 Tax=Plantactinospora sp. BB1 TaxID=2071627 RepID=UPI000D16FF20|nr:TetR/AcrR family transcriptional regulator [Plantactinospora sp. BB1]AVT38502.1 TetR family transcriptional regulator [Plantactinospora sp. BB1]
MTGGPAPTGRRGGPRAGDTRSRIQDVALGLFVADGYDRTSLREVADRLGLTKAALYYHFRAKEDIVDSLIEERIAALDELIEWAEREPDPVRMRREFVRRYASDLYETERQADISRFVARNPTVVNALPGGRRLAARMRRALELLVVPDEPLGAQLRRILAVFCLHAGELFDEGLGDERERRTALLEIALETMESADGATARRDRQRSPAPAAAPARPGTRRTTTRSGR